MKLEIPDFTTKMNGGQDEKVDSPTFRIRGKDLRIQVKPNDRNSKNIGVYLLNHSKDTVTATFTVKNVGRGGGSVQSVFKKREIEAADQGLGLSVYKSHKEYRWFIKSEDDVFRLEFEVTLYFIVEESDCPKKRYPVSSVSRFELQIYFCFQHPRTHRDGPGQVQHQRGGDLHRLHPGQ